MKRKLFTALFLSLLFTLVLTTALALSCSSCGKTVTSDANFCYNCGAKIYKGSSSSSSFSTGGVSITGASVNDDGTVTLRWTDSGNNGPYDLQYEFMDEAPNSFYWTDEENVRTKSFSFAWLVPGVDYILSVEDKNGNTTEYEYYASNPYYHNEIGSSFTLTPILREGSSSEDVSRFSASAITRNNGNTQYGMRIKLRYSQLRKPRTYRYMFGVEAPNSYAEIVWAGTLELPAGNSSLSPWNFIPLTDYFRILETYYEEVPVGDYTVTLYYDGTPVISETFYVGS